MNTSVVSIEAVCAVEHCPGREIFLGATGSEARRKAFLAGWRNTPDRHPDFGHCPNHANGGKSLGIRCALRPKCTATIDITWGADGRVIKAGFDELAAAGWTQVGLDDFCPDHRPSGDE